MTVQGHPTKHIDLSSKTNAILSMQCKTIHLLSTYTLISYWKHRSENMEGSSLTNVVNFGMNHIDVFEMKVMFLPSLEGRKGSKIIKQYL